MDNLVMMGLGSFLFGISTQAYQEMDRKAEARWRSNKPLNAAPVFQFLGPGEDEITLRGVIYPQWTPGFEQLQGMREMMKAGKPMMLCAVTGTVMGMHVITAVNDKNSIFHSSGMPRKVEFDVTLQATGSGGSGVVGQLLERLF